MTLSREALVDALTAAIADPDETLARVPSALRYGPAPLLISERQIAAAVETVMALQRAGSRRRGRAPGAPGDPDAQERILVALAVLADSDGLGPDGCIDTARDVLRGDTILDRPKRGAR